MRFAWLARTAGVVSIAAAAISWGFSVRAGATPPVPMGAKHAPPQLCRTASLRLSRGPAGGAKGRAYAVWDLANASGSSCDLEGFPHIDLLRPDGQGQAVRNHTTVGRGYFSPAVAVDRVQLAPGSAADFWIEWVERAGRLRGSMLVTPPKQRRAIQVANRDIELDVGTVTVSPLTSTVLTS